MRRLEPFQLFALAAGLIMITHAEPEVMSGGMGLLFIVFMVLIVFGLLGHFFSFFLGRGASDVAIGTLLSILITGVLVLLVLPIKIVKRWLWWRE